MKEESGINLSIALGLLVILASDYNHLLKWPIYVPQ